MKKIISIFVLVTILLMSTAIVPLTVSAAGTKTIGGVEYTLISTPEEFQSIVNTTGNYALTSDIALDQTTGAYKPGTFAGTLIGVNEDASAEEVRTITITADGSKVSGLFTDFTNNTTIKNIKTAGTIKSTGDYTAAFAAYMITAKKTITFINCENAVDIIKSGNVSNVSGAAGFVGRNNGYLIFEDCINSGDITLEENYTSSYAAGFVVNVANTSGLYSSLTNCKNTGNITGASYTAGLAVTPVVKPTLTVTNCYNTGNITSNRMGAGLATGVENNSTKVYQGKITIDKSYNAGKITVEETKSQDNPRLGGLVAIADTATITDSFNAGKLSVKDVEDLDFTWYEGRIVASAVTATLSRVYDASGADDYAFVNDATTPAYTNCYYLANDTGVATAGVQALSEDDMKNESSFAFDFGTVWTMGEEEQNYYFPQLIGNEYIAEINEPYGVTAPTMFNESLNTVADNDFFVSLDDSNAVNGKYSKLIYNKFIGTENEGTGKYGFILSTDATLDANDTFIAATSPLAGIYFYSANAGTYYVGAVIYDADDNIVAQSDALTEFTLAEVETAE